MPSAAGSSKPTAALASPKPEPRSASIPTSQTPTVTGSPLPASASAPASASGSQAHLTASGAKRRYRRHPKPDPNAPVKPVSAFVTFSSNLRNEESLKDKSFAEMSVLVGERWQALPKAVKEVSIGWVWVKGGCEGGG